ncbi:MAG: tol-pal system-associated acyl-CoA thioesterase [Betaproteobacteria bacterium]|nr:tol-pal system-associated acyl-CoA thioesterase [Betaproteobacteria bacterium]
MSQPSFSLPVRVYYEDTDAAGVVYYASYLKFLERARTEWLRALGYEQQQLAEAGAAFVVRAISAEYLKPARLDDLLTVVSSIGPLGRAQVVFVQRVERNGEILLEATVRVACIDPQRGKARALPKDTHEKFKALI